MPDLSEHEALVIINKLRCNVIGTQNAGWSNLMYPLVAVLDLAGFSLEEPTQEQMKEHLATYGGGGGYPGHCLREALPNWNNRLVGSRENLVEMSKRFLDDPSEQNRGYLEKAIERAEEVKR